MLFNQLLLIEVHPGSHAAPLVPTVL